MIASHPPARTALVRSILIFTPFLAIALVGFGTLLAEALNGKGTGSIVGSVLVGLVTMLLAYQVVQSLRDLIARPIEQEGLVERRWNRSEFVLFRNTYVFIEGNVFRLSPEQEIHVDLGDHVRVRYYTHTATVEAIEVVRRVGAQGNE